MTVLTGFLGAGKTTLLNRLLADPALAGTAVIVNEFGAIGLDQLLIAQPDRGVVELSAGCLCCTIRDELAGTLETILRDLDNGRLSGLRRIVIETTGLADPVPVLQSILLHPYLSRRLRIDGVVTVVDAVNGEASLAAQVEAVRQVAVADRLVLTKTDLAPAAGLVERLRRINPGALILDAAAGEATAARLIDLAVFDPATRGEDVRAWLAEEAFAEAHRHHGYAGHHHHHDVNRHGDDIRAFAVAADKALPRAALASFLELLATAHGPRLLRVKGIVRVAEDPDHPLIIQGAQALLHPPVSLAAWPDGDRRSRLVFITRDLPEGLVRRLFEAFAGELRPDLPDAAALTHNPLAVSGFTPGRR